MSVRRVLRRSLVVAVTLSLMLSLVPMFVAPAAANGCYGEYYDISQWTTSLTPVGGGVPIVRSGSGDYVEVCYGGGKVTSIYVEAGYSWDMGSVNAAIFEPAWKIAGASTNKPSATLKNAYNEGLIYGGGIVVLPGGAYGYMMPGTTTDMTINYNNGKLTLRFDGKVCSESTCFKFKTEIKGIYDDCQIPSALPAGVRPADC